MEEKIEERLCVSDFSSQDELKAHVSSVHALIRSYEQFLYGKGGYDTSESEKIMSWHKRLRQIVQKNRGLSERVAERSDDMEEFEKTARVVQRQLSKADANQQVLDKSTLKLIGLSYTSSDIDRVLSKVGDRSKDRQKKERKEIAMVAVAFVVFLCICILILFDKFVSKR